MPLGPNGVFLLPDQPTTTDMIQVLQQQNQRRRLEQEQRAQREQERQLQVAKYLGDSFDPKKFSTYTQDAAAQKMKDWVQLSMQNSGAGLPAFQGAVDKDLAQIQKTDGLIKSGIESIDRAVKQYEKSGIDTESLRNLAIHDLVYNVDKAGNKTLKTPEELEKSLSNFNIGRIMAEHPEKIADVNGNPLFDLDNKDAFVQKGKYNHRDSKGAVEERGYEVGYHPDYQRLEMVDGVPTVVKRDEVTHIKNQLGQNIEHRIADQHSFDAFMSNPSRRAWAFAKYKELFPGAKIDLNDKETIMELKTIVHGVLPSQPAKMLNLQEKEQKALDPKVNVTVTTSTTTGDDSGKTKNKSTVNDIIYQALTSNKHDGMAQDVPIKQPNGENKIYKDIMPALGGEYKAVNPNTGKPIKVSNILYDPSKKMKDGGGLTVYFEREATEEERKNKSLEIHKKGDKAIIMDKFGVRPDHVQDWMLKNGRLNADGGNFTKSDEDVQRAFSGGSLLEKVGNSIKRRTTVRRSTSGR